MAAASKQASTSRPGAGPQSWLAVKAYDTREMPTNDEFWVLARSRLNLDIVAQEQPCCHRYKVDGKIAGPPCPKHVDRKAHHAFCCSVGGFTMGRHHSMRDTVADECVAAGHRDVEKEVAMPQWTVPDEGKPGKYRQAVLDVFSRPPPKFQQLCWDTHCFHPWTAKGKAAKVSHDDAELEKHERYPTTDLTGKRSVDVDVTAVVYSTYGGCGSEAERAFARLQQKTNRFGKRFVARLALVVVKAAARQVLAALGRARETFGLAELSLPPPPVAVPRPGAAPHPWDAAARHRAALLTAESEEEDDKTDGKAPTHGDAAADDDVADDDAEAQPERRRCQQCNHDRPEGAFAPTHWAGTNRGGENRRRCLGCAPHTPNGQRFCSQCERSKNTREFGPNVNGRVQRVCRTCTSTQERLTFFVENSPRLSEY